MNDNEMLALAVAEARAGLAEGGIPIGAALVHDGEVLGVGERVGLAPHSIRVAAGCPVSIGPARLAA